MGAPTEKKDKRHNKHLTKEQRVKIESSLNEGLSINEIAKSMNKPASTISREIYRNRMFYPATKNDCVKHGHCHIKNLCADANCNAECSRKCSETCLNRCNYYMPAICEKLEKPPHVCNGCKISGRCKLDRMLYKAAAAQEAYSNKLSSTRKGFDLTDEELEEINDLFSKLIRQGQTPYHILKSHPELPLSNSTIYRLINSCKLDVRPVDLKQAVKRKPRKRKRGELHQEGKYIIPSKAGRMWGDYLAYMEENDVAHVEMDCVEGKQGEDPAILTLHFPDLQMQIGRILNRQDSANVVEALDTIERLVGTDTFREAFPVILTDNGSEFTDIKGMERSCIDPNRRRCRIFFCEPNRPDQKGSCENNHKLVRDIIPKGTSLMFYNQSDITLMMNHINSFRRKKSRGLCAYDRAMQVLPEEFFDRLGLCKIPDDKIILKPKLLTSRIKERTVAFDHSPI